MGSIGTQIGVVCGHARLDGIAHLDTIAHSKDAGLDDSSGGDKLEDDQDE